MRGVLAGLAAAAAIGAAPQPGPVDYGPLPTMRGYQPPTVSRVEPRFSAAASLVSGGRAVEARCWSTAEWARLRSEWAAAGFDSFFVAYVNPNDPEPQTRIHLSPSICTLLGKLTYKRAWTVTSRKLDLARAVVTLSHEAQHIRGASDEPTAECRGLQRARTVARSLGLTRSQADAVVSTYWRFQFHRRPAYVSPECRQGGALDVNAARVFP